jgi:hypothetical protein
VKRALALVVLGLAVIAVGLGGWGWIVLADPFCWHGRIVEDGRCAWE